MTDSAQGVVVAPWTVDQVEALNAFQRNAMFHPFTCANRSEEHSTHDGPDLGVLVATVEGWVCRDCDYQQDWAHTFMLNPAPPVPLPWL